MHRVWTHTLTLLDLWELSCIDDGGAAVALSNVLP